MLVALVVLVVLVAGCNMPLSPGAPEERGVSLSVAVSGLSDVVSSRSGSPGVVSRGLVTTNISSAEIVVDGGNFAAPITSTVSLSGGSGSASISGLQIGSNRVIKVTGLDAAGNAVPGAVLYGSADIYPGDNSATVNWETTARGKVFEALLASDRSNGTSYADSTDAAALQTRIESIINSNSLTHASLVDAAGIASDMISNAGAIPSSDSFVVATGSVQLDVTGLGSGSDSSVVVTLVTASYGNEVNWTIEDSSGTEVAAGTGYGTYSNNSTYDSSETLPAGDYTLNLLDSFGDGWHGGHISVAVGGQTQVNQATISSGSSNTATFSVPTTTGGSWPISVRVTDPASEPVLLEGNGSYSVGDVLPGDWKLILSVNNGGYEEELTLDTVAAGADTTTATDAGGASVDLTAPWDLSGVANISITHGGETVPVEELTLSSNVVFLPSGFETPTTQPTGDFVGMPVRAGQGEVAGFAAETTAGGATDAQSVVSADEGILSADTSISGLSSIGSNTQGDLYTARYVLTYGSQVEASDVRNKLIELIGLSQSGGSVSGLPTGIGATTTTSFRFIITVKYVSSTEVVKTVAVTPEASYTTYEAEINAFVDGTNIATAGTVRATTQDTFTAASGGTAADFLFVVDNSGSMSNEQTAVSQAAGDFWSALSSSGLDFHVGVITTDSDTLRGSGFTDVQTTFEADVTAGTSGSGTETGIYYAESALSPGGTVEAAGYPRPGASMSVIVLSDEDSQYTSRAGAAFDPSSNLFVSNGYRFYSIINTSDAGQYDDLSSATNGTVADINDLTVFSQIMNTIAGDAGGASSSYQLSRTGVISATINVTVNGSAVAKSTTDGWSYVSSSNTIVFYGSALPAGGASIVVDYEWKQ